MTQGIKIFFIAFFISLPFWLGINFLQKSLENFFYAQISQPLEEITFVKIPEKPELELQAKSAISVRISQTGRKKTLFAKDSEEILPIASLTKLMTAVIVLENPKTYDFYRPVSISKKAALQEDVPNYGNLIAGEKKTIEELLNLMLIYSSNDAAFALSEVIGVENFIEKMNQKAEELNLTNTHFVNPTGLDPENENLHFNLERLDFFNYSTPKDLVKLSQHILKEYPLIFEISFKKGPYLIENGISSLILPGNFKILGGKTGYTDEAGGCMVLVLKNKNEAIFVNVILGTPTVEARIEEMQKLIDWLNI